MSLQDWVRNGWLVEHRTSPEEIADLFGVVERDLSDCRSSGLSADARLSLAYGAALEAAKAALAAEGYRPPRESHHVRVIESLPYTMGADATLVAQFDRFRKKRNIGEYERAGAISEQEAKEMLRLATKLRDDVRKWLRAKHPDLLGTQ